MCISWISNERQILAAQLVGVSRVSISERLALPPFAPQPLPASFAQMLFPATYMNNQFISDYVTPTTARPMKEFQLPLISIIQHWISHELIISKYNYIYASCIHVRTHTLPRPHRRSTDAATRSHVKNGTNTYSSAAPNSSACRTFTDYQALWISAQHQPHQIKFVLFYWPEWNLIGMLGIRCGILCACIMHAVYMATKNM